MLKPSTKVEEGSVFSRLTMLLLRNGFEIEQEHLISDFDGNFVVHTMTAENADANFNEDD